jgi:hypothetical protein
MLHYICMEWMFRDKGPSLLGTFVYKEVSMAPEAQITSMSHRMVVRNSQ